jgi:7-carboxy-7-deazaguanine synthase
VASIQVNEIFLSIQGESSFAGLPCVFVRLTGCNLRCRYCDTTFAYDEGTFMEIAEIMQAVRSFGTKLVEVTGGEPLLQEEAHRLLSALLSENYRVLLETNGSIDLSRVDPRVVKIVDIKCPGSGESERMRWENIGCLREEDEVKFVLTSRADYEWAKGKLEEMDLAGRCKVLFSPAYGFLAGEPLAEWILADRLPVRLQLQLQKILWGPGCRGV